MDNSIQLIVGLGNPGMEYHHTRHNAGADFIEYLCSRLGTSLKSDARFSGLIGECQINSQKVRLLVPTTYMNRSGIAVQALANFYKIEIHQILICHDELDLPPGTVRLKIGGGHGGHNGLRDIIRAFGGQAGFQRLRFGIGHPGSASLVTGYALSKASQSDTNKLIENFDAAFAVLNQLVAGHTAKAMQQLHTTTEQ